MLARWRRLGTTRCSAQVCSARVGSASWSNRLIAGVQCSRTCSVLSGGPPGRPGRTPRRPRTGLASGACSASASRPTRSTCQNLRRNSSISCRSRRPDGKRVAVWAAARLRRSRPAGRTPACPWTTTAGGAPSPGRAASVVAGADLEPRDVARQEQVGRRGDRPLGVEVEAEPRQVERARASTPCSGGTRRAPGWSRPVVAELDRLDRERVEPDVLGRLEPARDLLAARPAPSAPRRRAGP